MYLSRTVRKACRPACIYLPNLQIVRLPGNQKKRFLFLTNQKKRGVDAPANVLRPT